MEHSNLYIPSVVSEFTHRELITPDNQTVEVYNNDIYLLFHQEKLVEDLGLDTVGRWVKSLRSENVGLGDFTDEQLFQFVKSRHIQSASELSQWSEYLSQAFVDTKGEITELVEKYNASVVSKPDPEPNPE